MTEDTKTVTTEVSDGETRNENTSADKSTKVSVEEAKQDQACNAQQQQELPSEPDETKASEPISRTDAQKKADGGCCGGH